MSKESAHPEIVQNAQLPEALGKHYTYLVVDPYAINLKDEGPRKGEVRLSFYSAFIVNAAREIFKNGVVDFIYLFSDASFGDKTLSTGDLMWEALTKERPNGSQVPPERAIQFGDQDLNQTTTQIEALNSALKYRGIESEEVLYLSWDYHRERIKNHAEGFGLNAKVISAEEVLKHYKPEFDMDELKRVLPLDEIEKMEKTRRTISRWDKKGRIPRLLKPLIGGSYMLDNRKVGERRPGHPRKLVFEYKPGKQKLTEFRSSES
ncbi:MAG: hypothetical protein AAB521_03560 [Patescibacteria group bacterium]